MNLTDIYKTFHQKTIKRTFFSSDDDQDRPPSGPENQGQNKGFKKPL